MAVPSAITDLSTTVASNSPAGSESPSLIDDYLRAQAGFIAQMYSGNAPLLASVSGTDTITGAVTPAPTAYAAGQVFRFVAAGANTTTSVTLNINSLGAKNVTRNGTTSLTIGDIPSGAVVLVVYDGTQFQLINTSKIADGSVTTSKIVDANVTASKLASGAAASNIGYTPANDSAVVHTTGNESIAGNKTFSGITQLGTISDGTNSTSSTNAIQGSAKAWVNFNGATGVINASFNVGSVTRNGTGDYTVNFTNALADSNYSGVAFPSGQAGTIAPAARGYSQTTSAFRIQTLNAAQSALQDSNPIGVAIFR